MTDFQRRLGEILGFEMGPAPLTDGEENALLAKADSIVNRLYSLERRFYPAGPWMVHRGGKMSDKQMREWLEHIAKRLENLEKLVKKGKE